MRLKQVFFKKDLHLLVLVCLMDRARITTVTLVCSLVQSAAELNVFPPILQKSERGRLFLPR